MTRLLPFLLAVLAVSGAAALGGCSSTSPEDLDDPTLGEVDPTLFVDAAIVGEITEEACVLSGGTETTCYRFSVNTDPVDHAAGPWCPNTIRDDASEGGIWPEGGELYDVDGSFIENLATFYNDPTWRMYDDDGNVRVTETQEACAAAANPNVGAEYANYCVECQTSYIEPQATITYVIPKQPVVVSGGTGATSDPMGVAFNGISFAPAAPTDRILAAYTLAPFDDCGGHVNLNVGYHYHEATGCGTRVTQSDGHAAMIGYALDGFAFHAQLNADGTRSRRTSTPTGATPTTRAATTTTWPRPARTSSSAGFRGEYGCALEGDGAGLTCDATQTGGPPGGGPPGGGPAGIRTGGRRPQASERQR